MEQITKDIFVKVMCSLRTSKSQIESVFLIGNIHIRR